MGDTSLHGCLSIVMLVLGMWYLFVWRNVISSIDFGTCYLFCIVKPRVFSCPWNDESLGWGASILFCHSQLWVLITLTWGGNQTPSMLCLSTLKRKGAVRKTDADAPKKHNRPLGMIQYVKQNLGHIWGLATFEAHTLYVLVKHPVDVENNETVEFVFFESLGCCLSADIFCRPQVQVLDVASEKWGFLDSVHAGTLSLNMFVFGSLYFYINLWLRWCRYEFMPTLYNHSVYSCYKIWIWSHAVCISPFFADLSPLKIT